MDFSLKIDEIEHEHNKVYQQLKYNKGTELAKDMWIDKQDS